MRSSTSDLEISVFYLFKTGNSLLHAKETHTFFGKNEDEKLSCGWEDPQNTQQSTRRGNSNARILSLAMKTGNGQRNK